VNGFAERAQQILDAAEAASRSGQPCSETTILIGEDGAIRMLTDTDWPLESLVLHHGARTAYRVTANRGTIKVEGRDGMRRCVFETVTSSRPACATAGTTEILLRLR
jgi:hypothetical protein